MKNLRNFIIGILIGTGLILPGVSGAVLAIAFGVYDELLESAANYFKNIKKYTLFLIPFVFGIFAGALLFGNLVLFLFDNYEIVTKSAFLGLIAGSLPVIIDKVKNKKENNFKTNYFLIALLLGILLFLIDKSTSIGTSINDDGSLLFHLKVFFGGIVYSIGKVVPGISSSFLLMILGLYNYIINLIAHPFTSLFNNPIIIIVFVFGFLFGFVYMSKSILYLIKKYQYESYSAIIGFVIGSMLILVPNYNLSFNTLISLIIFALMFSISYLFSIKEIAKKK